MRITIKDVAKQANVSQATVSLVLNEAPGISAPTREHVLNVMKELNYRPDALARSFSSRRAQCIGLVMPPSREAFDDPYFTQLLRGVLEGVRDQGYQMILEIADERFTEQKLWHNLFATKRIDGLLIATPYLDQDYLQDLAESEIPALLINGARPDLPQLSFVGYDDVRCGIDATYYLIGLGHRRVAHLAGPQNQASAINRLQGYQEALMRARIPFDASLIFPGDYKRELAESAMQQILSIPHSQRPTALYCANDTMAIAAMHTIQASGLCVPQDFSVIGVDDTGAAATASPALTTLRQDIFALARLATDRFISRLEARSKEAISVKEFLPMEIVERSSCTLASGAQGER